MTKAQARDEAECRWGKRAIIRHNPRALREEQKAPLRQRLAEVRELLKTTPRTPETIPTRRQLYREERDLFGVVISYRCDVGERMDILNAFHVRGSGDTWEAAFAKATPPTA